MATGTIEWFNGKRGEIIPDDESGKVEFFADNLEEGGDISRIVKGARVHYKLRQKSHRARTYRFELLDTESKKTVSESRPEAKPNREPTKESYRFLNPYNFVRFLDRPNPEPKDEAASEQKLLWRCPPPPHDRYVGLTGRITCEVEAVTPLFVSDSHGIKDDQGHKTYRFFQYDGKPALPASSLRGMVRSVFEAVTNSCLGVFVSKHLSFHLPSEEAKKLVPARVEKIDGDFRLKLLPGTNRINLLGPSANDPQYAAWIKLYQSMQGNLTAKAKPNSPYARRSTLSIPANLKHGSSCAVIVEKMQHPPRQNRQGKMVGQFDFWNVIHIASTRDKLPQPDLSKNQKVVDGWLCITNQNIENKHDERVFFTDQPFQYLPLPNPIIEAYQALIEDYQDRHKDGVKKRQENNQLLDKPIFGTKPEAGYSRFNYQYQECKLQGGELVYAMLTGTTAHPQVEFIVPVSVPRVGYKNDIGDLRSKHLYGCSDYNCLCPACRTFGWVAKEKTEGQQAYAGRVRFSHGQLKESKGELPDTPLAILSTPKPTTTLFYLLDKNGKPGDVTYDTPNAQLRGRKVYRHHGNQLREKEYTRAPNGEQNRTVRGALDKGSTFTFTIDFENLAEVELGALLWALELEKDMFHRLGYAKPLGFGSVKIKVTKVERLYPEQRYASLESWDAGWQEIGPDQLDPWKQGFKETLTALYGDFNKLTSITDLRALLSEPPNLHIHYPRPSTAPSDKEENFKWFVVNNKSKPVALPLPEDEKNNPTKNLQVWDEKGNIKS